MKVHIVKSASLLGCVFFLLTTIGLSVGIAVAVTFPRSEEAVTGSNNNTVFFDTGSTEWANTCTREKWTLFTKTNTLGSNMQYVVGAGDPGDSQDTQGNHVRNSSFYVDNLQTINACKKVCELTTWYVWLGTCVQVTFVAEGNDGLGKCYFKSDQVASWAAVDATTDTYGLCRLTNTHQNFWTDPVGPGLFNASAT